MENLPDHIFSSSWILTAIFIVLLIVTSFIAYGTNFFKKKIYNWIYKGIVLIIPFSPIFLDIFMPLKYGFSYEIPVMQIIGNKLCLLDKKEKGDDSSDWEEYRLHVLNAETGEKISRQFYNDIYDIGYSKGDSILLFSYWQFDIVDISTNKAVRIITKEYLQSRFPEFSSGIESMNYSKSQNDGSQTLTISVTAKTAKTYYYDPFSDALLPNEINQNQPSLNYYFSNDNIYWRNIKNEDERIVSLEYSKESSKIKQLKFENKNINNSLEIAKNEFLEAEFLALFPDEKLFILVSYETTDKINFNLDAFGFDGKHKWNIKQTDLNLKDKYFDEPKLNSSIRYHDNLIFNCGGFIVSINANTGKINWKQRV